MTAKIIHLEKLPKRMECCECDGDEFSLHDNGSIRCWNCGGQINAAWVRLTSSSPETGEAPSVAG